MDSAVRPGGVESGVIGVNKPTGVKAKVKTVDDFETSDQLLRIPEVSPPPLPSVMHVPKGKDVWVGDNDDQGQDDVAVAPRNSVSRGVGGARMMGKSTASDDAAVELSVTRTRTSATREREPSSGGDVAQRQPAKASPSKDDSSGSGNKADFFAKLKELQAQKEAGAISEAQYVRQKQVLIDFITGTSLNQADKGGGAGAVERAMGAPVPRKGNLKKDGAKGKEAVAPKKLKWEVHHGFYMGKAVVPKAPPDFTGRPSERALQYVFNVATGEWKTREVHVKLERKPFARGSLRLAYHMSGIDQSEEAAGTTYVAKISIDPFEEREFYFKDVAMQMYTREYAEKYNTYLPPKRIYFVKAYLLELVDRPTRPLCAVERFIRGPYRKHNNNFGYVNEEERSTPQAFSHFTYEASQHRILICDIQGVGDMYTDPQIHSRDGRGFGKGNMGERGFKKFLKSHRCNAVCRYLRLPEINAKSEHDDRGTVPSERYMMHPQVAVINLELKDAHVDQVLGEIVRRHTQEQLLDGQRRPLLGAPEKKWCHCTIL